MSTQKLSKNIIERLGRGKSARGAAFRLRRVNTARNVAAALFALSYILFLCGSSLPAWDTYHVVSLFLLLGTCFAGSMVAGYRREDLAELKWEDRSTPAGPSSPISEEFALINEEGRYLTGIFRTGMDIRWLIPVNGEFIVRSFFRRQAMRKAEDYFRFNDSEEV